jgi:dTDP-4-amino-4,6-dideoxygalactose transaminase
MEWRVPLSDIDLDENELGAVERVLRSRWLSMGPVTREFEEAFAQMVGARHAFATSNGTTALHLAYAALGLGPGDEVIVPALTFVATANAVVYTGATPIFADCVSLDDLTVSSDDIEAKITDRTRAIAVMHYGGYLCDMDAIRETAERRGLAIVEDACHAPGATYRGRGAGALGAVGCFSFFSNKNIAMGEGGMVVTDDDQLAERIRLMRSHGMTTLTWDRHRGHASSYDVVLTGYNYRLDEIHSAIGLCQLGKLARNNERRAAIVARYRAALAGAPGLRIPFAHPPSHTRPAYHLFPVILEPSVDRAAFMARLREAGIQTSIHYPPIHQFTAFQGRAEGISLPVTEAAGGQEVTLPLFPTESQEQVQQVIDVTLSALDASEAWRASHA